VATSRIKLLLAITSPIAFLKLNSSDLISHAISVAESFCVENGSHTHLTIAAPSDLMERVRKCCAQMQVQPELLEVDPLDTSALASALASSKEFEILGIHDAQRPLTRTAQFHRVLGALVGGAGAARPDMAFTETLKIINDEGVLVRTVDRNSIRRLSTPEFYQKSAIDFSGQTSTWFVPLVPGTITTEVETDPESLRANTSAEVELLEALLHWQQKVV
jgi:2-C-methyl-D-erythritol 4-phosphate cytidylyltransferase